MSTRYFAPKTITTSHWSTWSRWCITCSVHCIFCIQRTWFTATSSPTTSWSTWTASPKYATSVCQDRCPEASSNTINNFTNKWPQSNQRKTWSATCKTRAPRLRQMKPKRRTSNGSCQVYMIALSPSTRYQRPSAHSIRNCWSFPISVLSP